MAGPTVPEASSAERAVPGLSFRDRLVALSVPSSASSALTGAVACAAISCLPKAQGCPAARTVHARFRLSVCPPARRRARGPWVPGRSPSQRHRATPPRDPTPHPAGSDLSVRSWRPRSPRPPWAQRGDLELEKPLLLPCLAPGTPGDQATATTRGPCPPLGVPCSGQEDHPDERAPWNSHVETM